MIDGLSRVEKELSNSVAKSIYSVDVHVPYIYPRTMHTYDCSETNKNTNHSIKKNCEQLTIYKMLEIILCSFITTRVSQIGQLS